ncbi:hypothetical protein [Phycicoccus sp. CSK15P-2]|uniref:hypothetical protein n=1 Tax=Phycicoccus sp. CSK15P-2 TaxID=2807627 RepID=UPI00194EEA6B|nr:hypothetical protein [Phycicoccus sp. CSK15P-2]
MARQSSLDASWVHIEGVLLETEDEDLEDIGIDLEGSIDGTTSRIVLRTDQGAVTMLKAEETVLMKGDWDFWAVAADEDAADALKGRWVKVPPDEASDFEDASVAFVIGEFFGEEQMSAKDLLGSSVKVRTHADREIWVARLWNGSELWYDPRAEHVVKATEPRVGELTFDHWDEPQELKWPPKGKIVAFDG